MDYSLELGKGVLRRTPDALQAMLSDLPEDWINGRTVHAGGRPVARVPSDHRRALIAAREV